MAILWGLLKETHEPLGEDELRSLAQPTERYASGRIKVLANRNIGMGTQSNETHARSMLDDAPLCDTPGNLICFDGRLDNFAELANHLGCSPESSDSAIALAGFCRWGQDCFHHLIGDFALTLWCADRQELFLARDHAGTRTLYFSKRNRRVLWGSYLETFRPLKNYTTLSREYAMRYLSCKPIRETTPFESIEAVLPGYYVKIRGTEITQHRHWTPIPKVQVRHKLDAEYEEHFFSLFRTAVSRRIGPGTPILAQLSGGIDSTSIVCMSDHIRKLDSPSSALLDTLSFFDDSEATLDERTYFEITERQRGKTGIHIDTSFSQRTFRQHDWQNGDYLFPGADTFAFLQEERMDRLVWSLGYKSVLSGIGGDEVTGGVAVADPELADYLMDFRWVRLLHRATKWSIAQRRPLLHSLYYAASYAGKAYITGLDPIRQTPEWIRTDRLSNPFANRFQGERRLYSRIAKPSSLDNAESWWAIMETLPHIFTPILVRPEHRYPLLDRDLVEFLFSIPREQVLRPGRRRSLLRRSLKNIVPTEVLERRQKAYQLRAPLKTISDVIPDIRKLFDCSVTEEMGFISGNQFKRALDRLSHEDISDWQSIIRTVAYELWLRSILRVPGPQSMEAHKTLPV